MNINGSHTGYHEIIYIPNIDKKPYLDYRFVEHKINDTKLYHFSYNGSCMSGYVYATQHLNTGKLIFNIYIPKKWLEGKKITIEQWVEFINKAGFSCSIIDKKPYCKNLLTKLKGQGEFICINIKAGVGIPRWYSLAVWTLIRYFYTDRKTYIFDEVAYDLKQKYPKLSYIDCIIYSHHGKHYDSYHALIPAEISNRKINKPKTVSAFYKTFVYGVHRTFMGLLDNNKNIVLPTKKVVN